MTESEPPSRARHVVRGLGSLTIQSVLNAVLGFVLLAALLRYLSLSDYGAYSSVQVTVAVAGAVASFGLPSAAVRFLAPSSSAEGSGWAPAKAALYLNFLLAGGVSLVLAALAPFLSGYFHAGSTGNWVFYFGAVWLFTISASNAAQSLLQGMRSYSLLARVLVLSRVIAVGFAVAGLALYHSLIVAIASQVVFAFLILASIVPVVLGPLRRAKAGPHYRAVLRYAYLLGLAGAVGAVAGNADIVIVGGYLSLGSLGVYNAAITISSVLGAFFVSPMITALFAETSYSAENEAEVRLGTRLALRFLVATLLPASFFAAAMAPQLFDLFSGGGSYFQGIPYLQLITLFYVFTGVGTIAINILQGVGRTREVLIIGAVTALGEVALSASLVPGSGLGGAAFSRVAIFVLGCGLSLYFIRDYLPRPFDYGHFGKAVIASAAPALAVYVPSLLVSGRVITIIPYTALGIAIFVACAKLLKLLSEEDKSYLSQVLPGGLKWAIRLF